MQTEKFLSGNASASDSENSMDYKKILEIQREYFRTGESSKLENRRETLKKLKKVLEENKDELTDGVYKDLRRRSTLTYMYEISTVLTEIDYMLDNLENWSATINAQKTFVTLIDSPKIVREPKGVILILGPWNYPLNTVLMPLIAVIATGNTAIIKPSELARNTSEALKSVFSKAFDQKKIAVITGGVTETSDLLQEKFDHIIFTGSTTVGRIVMSAAAKHLTPCTLELGGKCPVVIEPDCDIEITARRIAWGKWLNCGQTCLAPDYILCNESTKTRLVDELTRVLARFYQKDAKNSVDYSRIINEHHFDRLSNLLDQTIGQKIHFGGEIDRSDLFIPPVILDVSLDDVLMEDEIFGPLLPIVTVDSFSNAVEIIAKRERPLAAYLFTRDERKVSRFLAETKSGSVVINDVILQLAVDTIPFGGIGNSGMGRYRGKFGFDEFTHEKAVLKRSFFGDWIAAARYPPLTDKKVAKLHQLTSKRRVFPTIISRVFRAAPFLIVGFILGFLCSKFY